MPLPVMMLSSICSYGILFATVPGVNHLTDSVFYCAESTALCLLGPQTTGLVLSGRASRMPWRNCVLSHRSHCCCLIASQAGCSGQPRKLGAVDTWAQLESWCPCCHLKLIFCCGSSLLLEIRLWPRSWDSNGGAQTIRSPQLPGT